MSVLTRLAVATGTYPCQWTYRGQVVPGEMGLEGSRSPDGRMFDAPDTTVKGENSEFFAPHLDNVDVLPGRLRSGPDAVLLDVRLTHWWHDQTVVEGRMALVGSGLPNDLLFSSVKFQVGGLTELAGVYPLKSLSLPITLDTDAQVNATWNAEAATQTWTNNGDELRLAFTASTTNPHYPWYGFALISAPVITVSGTPRSAEDWMRQYVRPLGEITTLATLRPQPVSWVTLYHGEKQFPTQLFAPDVAQQPYDAAPPETSALISRGSGTLIRLGPNGATLPDLLAGWQSLQTTYVTFFDYLTVALRDTMSLRSRFLALIPALEGYHVAKYGDGQVPRKEFSKQRKAVIERVSVLGEVNGADVDFLKTWLNTYGSYPLAYRLRELVNRELGDGLRNRVGSAINPLPAVLLGLVENPADTWAVMGTARNRIAHGSDNQPARAQLAALTQLAHTVAVGSAERGPRLTRQASTSSRRPAPWR